MADKAKARARAKPSPAADPHDGLRFDLSFSGGRGLLVKSDLPLSGPLRAPRLVLELPEVQFPFDVTGGSDRFRNTRCNLRVLVLQLAADALATWLADQAGMSGTPFRDLRLTLLTGAALVSGELALGGQRIPFTFRLAFPVLGPHEVGVHSYGFMLYGPAPFPAPLLAHYFRTLLPSPFQEGDDPVLWQVPVPQLVARRLFPARGWKIPDARGIMVQDVTVERAGITITCGERGGASDEQSKRVPAESLRELSASRLTLAAERKLLRGEFLEAYTSYRHAEEDSGVAEFCRLRRLQIACAVPELAEDAHELAHELLAQDADSPPAVLAEAQLAMRRGQLVEAGRLFERLAGVLPGKERRLERLGATLAAARCHAPADPELAAQLYEKAAAGEWNLPSLQQELFEIKARVGDAKSAAGIAERMLRRWGEQPEIAALRPRLIQLYISPLGDAEGAQRHLQEMLAQRADDPIALELMADLYAAQDKPQRAVACLAQLAQQLAARRDIEHHRQVALKAAAIWEGKLGDDGQALTWYRRMLDLDEGDQRALAGALALHRRRGELEQSIAVLQAMIAAGERGGALGDEDLGRLYLQLAELMGARGRGSSEVVAMVERAADLMPGSAEAQERALGILQLHQQWIELLRRLRSCGPRVVGADRYRALGVQAIDKLLSTQRPLAIDSLDQLVRHFPRDAELIERRLALLFEDGDVHQALAWLERQAAQVEEQSTRADLFFRAARMARDHGLPAEQSASFLERCLDAAPAHREALRELVGMASARGDLERQVALLARLQQTAADLQEGRRWATERAEVLALRGDPRLAIEAIEELLAGDATEVGLWRLQYRAQTRLGAGAAAADALAAVLQRTGGEEDPDAQVTWLALAQLRVELGHHELAVEPLEQHLARHPDDHQARSRLLELLDRLGRGVELVAQGAQWLADGLLADERGSRRLIGLRAAELERDEQALTCLTPLAASGDAAVDAALLAVARRTKAHQLIVTVQGAALARLAAGDEARAPLLEELALAHESLGQEEQARARYNELVALMPEAVAAWGYLMRAAEGAGAFEEAVAAANAMFASPQLATQRTPAQLDHLSAARALIAEFQPAQLARIDARLHEALGPEAALPILSAQPLGQLYRQHGRWQSLFRLLTYRYQELSGPGKLEVGLQLLELLAGELGLPQHAAAILSELQALNPDDARLRVAALAIYRQVGEWEQLVRALRELSASGGPSAARYLVEAADVAWGQLHEQAQARELMLAVVDAAPLADDCQARAVEVLRAMDAIDLLWRLWVEMLGDPARTVEALDGLEALAATHEGFGGQLASALRERLAREPARADLAEALWRARRAAGQWPELCDDLEWFAGQLAGEAAAVRWMEVAQVAAQRLADRDRAIVALQRAVACDPHSELREQLLEQLRAAGRWREASGEIAALIAAMPYGETRDHLCRELARVALDFLDDQDLALSAMTQISAPQAEDHRWLADAYLARGQHQRYVQAMSAIEPAGLTPDERCELAHVLVHHLNDTAAAEQLLAALPPDDRRAQEILAEIYAATDRPLDAAQAAALLAAQAPDPASGQRHAIAASSYYALAGRAPEALSAAIGAVEGGALESVALEALRACLGRVLPLAAQQPEYHAHGWYLWSQLAPTHGPAEVALGLALADAAGRVDWRLSGWLRLRAMSAGPELRAATLAAAAACEALGDDEGAWALLCEQGSLDPDDEECWALAGEVARRSGDQRGHGLALARRALARPDEPSLTAAATALLTQQGRSDELIELLQRLAERCADPGRALAALADAARIALDGGDAARAVGILAPLQASEQLSGAPLALLFAAALQVGDHRAAWSAGRRLARELAADPGAAQQAHQVRQQLVLLTEHVSGDDADQVRLEHFAAGGGQAAELVEWARGLLAGGKPDLVEATLEAASARLAADQAAELWWELAAARLAARASDEAQRALTACDATGQPPPAATIALADLLLGRGERAAAMPYLQRISAEDLDAASPGERRLARRLAQAEEHLARGAGAEAVAVLTTLAPLDPLGPAGAVYERALLAVGEDERLCDWLEEHAQALAGEPATRLWRRAAELHRAANRWRRAALALQAVGPQGLTDEEASVLVTLLESATDTATLEAVLGALEASQPAADLLATWLLEAARAFATRLAAPARAIELHERSWKLDAGATANGHALLELYRDGKDLRGLRRTYQRLLDTLPGGQVQEEVALRRGLASLLRDELDDPAAALGSYQRLLELEPSDGTHLSALVDCARRAGLQHQAGQALLDLAREPAPPTSQRLMLARARELVLELPVAERGGVALAASRAALRLESSNQAHLQDVLDDLAAAAEPPSAQEREALDAELAAAVGTVSAPSEPTLRALAAHFADQPGRAAAVWLALLELGRGQDDLDLQLEALRSAHALAPTTEQLAAQAERLARQAEEHSRHELALDAIEIGLAGAQDGDPWFVRGVELQADAGHAEAACAWFDRYAGERSPPAVVAGCRALIAAIADPPRRLPYIRLALGHVPADVELSAAYEATLAAHEDQREYVALLFDKLASSSALPERQSIAARLVERARWLDDSQRDRVTELAREVLPGLSGPAFLAQLDFLLAPQLEAEEWEAAVTACVTLSELAPGPDGQAALFYRMGTIWRERLLDRQRAAEHFEAALRAREDFAAARRALGDLCFEQEQWQQALDQYQLAASLPALSSDAQLALRIGELRVRLDDLTGAVTEFMRSLSLDNQAALPFFRLGQVRQQLGDAPGAIAAFDNFLTRASAEHAPEASAARRTLAALLLAKGEAPRALSLLEELPATERELDPGLLYALYLAVERWDDAIALKRRELDAHAGEASEVRVARLRELAELVSAHGQDLAQARSMLEEAFDLAPTDTAIALLLADLYAAQGDDEKHILAAERVAALEGDSALSGAQRRSLAQAYLRVGGDSERAAQLMALAEAGSQTPSATSPVATARPPSPARPASPGQPVASTPATPVAKAPQEVPAAKVSPGASPAAAAPSTAPSTALTDEAALAEEERALGAGGLPVEQAVARWRALATAYLHVKHDVERAAVALYRAHQLRPDDLDLIRTLAQTYALDPRFYQHALTLFGNLMAREPVEIEYQRMLARLSGQVQRLDQAFGHYRLLAALDPSDDEATRFVQAAQGLCPAAPAVPLFSISPEERLLGDEALRALALWLPAVGSALTRLQAGELAELGVVTEQLVEPPAALKPELARLCEILSVERPEVAVVGGGPVTARILAGPAPRLVIGEAIVRDLPEPGRRFLLARELIQWRQGLLPFLGTDEAGLGRLWQALIALAQGGATDGGPRSALARLDARPRQLLAQRLPELQAWLPRLAELRQALQRLTLQLALLVCAGDIGAALAALGLEQGLAGGVAEQLRSDPQARQLFIFAGSAVHFELRKQLGTELRGEGR